MHAFSMILVGFGGDKCGDGSESNDGAGEGERGGGRELAGDFLRDLFVGCVATCVWSFEFDENLSGHRLRL